MGSQEGPPEKRSKLDEVLSLWEKKRNKFSSKIFSDLYLDEKTADVWFKCGTEGDRIPAHKCILSKSSDVFDAMFYGKNAKDGDKEYPETDATAFKEFLKLCYMDEVGLNPNNIIEVMKLTHHFLMFDSLKFCGELWADNMNFDDVCVAYHWAIHFKMDDLKEFCERKISVYPIFETTSFLNCEHGVLEDILRLETLLCDEKFVLQACLNWAGSVCKRDGSDANEMSNLRKYLKNALYKVRYSSLAPKEFSEIMDSKNGLFIDFSDYEDIFRLTTASGDSKTGRFNSNKRLSYMPWREDSVSEYDMISTQNMTCNTIIGTTSQKVTLQSNQPILLGEIYFPPLIESGHKVTIQIKITQDNNYIHSGQIDEHSKKESCFDLIKNPIVIRPDLEYTISLEISFGSTKYRGVVNYCTPYFSDKIVLGKQTSVYICKKSAMISKFKFNIL